jgi:hypothetical protein
MDVSQYPGSKLMGSRWINGILKFFGKGTLEGQEIFSIDPVNKRLIGPGQERAERFRLTNAQINAGVTILPAVPGYKYRLVDSFAIAYGGNVGATTGVDLTATLSGSSRKLVAYKTAGLTQSTLLRAGTATNGIILADGASFTQNDVNTGISVIKDGSDLTTSTGVDIHVHYCLEAA